MVKCLNCGSTAQVRLICGTDLNDEHCADLNWVHQHWSCGCGRTFHIDWVQEGVFLDK